MPPVYLPNQVVMYHLAPASEIQNQARPGVGGIVLDISPKAWAAYEQSKVSNPAECSTCDSRKYQDVSNDSSVSFQTPTHISPGASASAVASHEAEHVSNERANAEQEGREIVSQTVSLSTSICPECKRVYVSGGTTRTLSIGKSEEIAPPNPASSDI